MNELYQCCMNRSYVAKEMTVPGTVFMYLMLIPRHKIFGNVLKRLHATNTVHNIYI